MNRLCSIPASCWRRPMRSSPTPRSFDLSQQSMSTFARRRRGAPPPAQQPRRRHHILSNTAAPSTPRLAALGLGTVPPAALSSSPLTADLLDALLSLSVALYEDEAVAPSAAPAPPTQLRRLLTGETAVEPHGLLVESDSAMKGCTPSAEAPAAPPPEDAFASVSPDELMAAMLMSDDLIAEPRDSGTRSGDGGCSGSGGRHTGVAAAPHSLLSQPTSSAGHIAEETVTEVKSSSSSVTLKDEANGLQRRDGAAALPSLPAALTSQRTSLEEKVLALLDALTEVSSSSAAPAPQTTLEHARRQRETLKREPAASSRGEGTARGSGCGATAKSLSADAVPASFLVAASSLILPGLDMKALLKHGELAHRHLKGVSLARCDFSHVRWLDMTVEDCDLSRCVFYQAEWRDVVFRRCRFDGALMKGVVCAGRVLFKDCDFRLAAVGLAFHSEEGSGQEGDRNGGDFAATGSAPSQAQTPRQRGGQPQRSSLRFVRCNFDLSDFQYSSGLSNPVFFVQCSNTDLASRFPLRSRSDVE